MSGVNVTDIKKAQEKVLGSTQSGTEPVAGIQGAGTADQPYDQGNQPEQSIATSDEPPSGQQGEGTADKPYDQGNQPEQESMNIVDQLSRTKTKQEIVAQRQRRHSQQPPSADQAKPTMNGTVTSDTRGRNHAESITASSAPKEIDPKKLAPKPRREIERSVSPGQLDDGSHVKCSGEKGEAYTPPSKLDKIKGKLHISSH